MEANEVETKFLGELIRLPLPLFSFYQKEKELRSSRAAAIQCYNTFK
jgi:hypothetical protein